jgi:hypothetical protein
VKFDDTDLNELIRRAETVISTLLNDASLSKISLSSANDVYKILNAATGLVRAKVELARWHAERTLMLDEAKHTLLEEFRTHVTDDEELLDKLRALYERSQEKLELPQGE